MARPNAPLWAWVIAGLLAYLLLPWYALQDANGLLAVGRTWGEQATANGKALSTTTATALQARTAERSAGMILPNNATT